MRKARWIILAGGAEFAYMALELLASRLLSPWFGSSHDIWTATIAVILLASAIGNAIGGRAAGKPYAGRLLAASMVVCSAWFAVLPQLSQMLAQALSQTGRGIPQTMACALACLALPGVCFGCIPPICVSGVSSASRRSGGNAGNGGDAVAQPSETAETGESEAAGTAEPEAAGAAEPAGSEMSEATEMAHPNGGIAATDGSGNAVAPANREPGAGIPDAGKASASVSVSMTIGGLAGTVLTGFLLLPAMGSARLSAAMSLWVAVLLIGNAIASRTGVAMCALAAVACAALSVPAVTAASDTGAYDTGAGAGGTEYADVWEDTEYGRVHIFDAMYKGRPIRILNIDGGYESAEYLDGGRDLVFDYTRNSVAAMGDAASGSVLCLGGGAYSIPQHIVRELGGQATVVEIDAGVTEAARKWFGLAQTEGIAGDRITTENMDGRVYLADCGRRFDAVFNDTFAGNTPARGLCTLEAVRLVKSCLAEGGLFVTNAIGVAQRDGESLLADEVATMREVFARVHVLWHEQPEDMGKRQNYIIVATDDMSWEVPDGLVEIEVSSGKTRILTDDDSPIEMLSASERNAD